MLIRRSSPSEVVALDKPSALLAEHMSALRPPAALQRPPGSPVCTHGLGLTPNSNRTCFPITSLQSTLASCPFLLRL